MRDATTERADEIAYAALEVKAPDERATYLEQACAGDASLRAAVDEMLSAQEDAESFFAQGSPSTISAVEVAQSLADTPGFSQNAGSVPLTDQELGRWIGPYKLLQRIGEGGCGVVYMAEQETPVRRRVALKVIKLGMDTKSVIARFEAERQALAMMDHPNIARVLDAGATETGRPYFVMELVRGVRITTYCDENRLDTRQRLDLFIQICNALQHAHQKGVIHRDIKPSNILVTMLDGVPVPKVIDFGIAKATGGERLTDKTVFTAYEQFVGTPAYMSPEQAEMSALDIDTRSDIYSLGVLLYELLTSKTPFDQKELLQSGIEEMRRTLREREPHRPSVKLNALRAEELTHTAVQRRIEPLKLKSLLRGDLDWIVMKALEKDRSRRYQTANGLGMEIQRYLANEPVIARPPSRRYLFQKLVRRNKVVFAAGAAVAFALAAGFGTSTWLFFRERQALREQARLREVAEQARNTEARLVVREREALREQARLREVAEQARNTEAQLVLREREALQEQARLREVAEQARNTEAQLRREAEAQAKIAQAAFFISRTNLAGADALVDKVDLPVAQPSLEAADVFRKLADWNVTRGQWKAAAARLLKLVQANQLDKTDMTDAATRGLDMVSATLVLIGDTTNHHRLMETTIARFSQSQNPVAAEQVVKTSTISPIDEKVITSLQPLAEVAEKSFAGAPRIPATGGYLFAWRAFALSRFEYRRGNYTNAIAWGKRSLAYSDNRPTCLAMNHVVLAMAYHKLHQSGPAEAELAGARSIIGRRFSGGLARGLPIGDDLSGYWHDWVVTLILLNEAASEIEGRPAAPLIQEMNAQSSQNPRLTLHIQAGL